MMRNHIQTTAFGPSAQAEAARVMVRIAYVLGRRGYTPVTPAREADT